MLGLHSRRLVRVVALQEEEEAQRLRLHRELPLLEVVAALLSMDSAVAWIGRVRSAAPQGHAKRVMHGTHSVLDR